MGEKLIHKHFRDCELYMSALSFCISRFECLEIINKYLNILVNYGD